MYKAHHAGRTVGSWNDEKVHAVVARNTFPSQNVQNTPGSDHFWKLRCWKSARRCGAKHISKSKCAKHTTFGRWDVEKVHIWQSKCRKHTMLGALLEVEMMKKCTPLWREHVEVKLWKNTTFGPLLDAKPHHTTLQQNTTTTTAITTTPTPTTTTTLQLTLRLQLQQPLRYNCSYKYNDNYDYNYNYSYNHNFNFKGTRTKTTTTSTANTTTTLQIMLQLHYDYNYNYNCNYNCS